MSGLILLHGFGGSPASWDAFRACLPSEQVVWAPELIGHGVACRAGHGFEDEVTRLLEGLSEVSRSTSTDRWWLVGYSMGGRLALGMLVRAAGLELEHTFAGGSLIGANPGLEGEEPRRARRRNDARWSRTLEAEGVEAFLEAWRAQPLFASQERLPAAELERQRRITLRHDPVQLACAMRALSLGSMPVYRDALGDIHEPVDWIVGSLDQKFQALAEEAIERMPARGSRAAKRGGRLVSVPEVGHNVVLEAPEQLARLVRDRVRQEQSDGRSTAVR